MPTYEYSCEKCGNKIEVLQKITDEPLKECPHCKEPSLRRGPGGGIGLSFKGSGFYITDYNSPSKPGSSPEKESPPKTEAKAASCCPCGKNSSCG